MNENPKKYQRKNLRLQHYDYARAGYYYVTVCTQNKKTYFGTIKEEPPMSYPNYVEFYKDRKYITPYERKLGVKMKRTFKPSDDSLESRYSAHKERRISEMKQRQAEYKNWRKDNE